MTAFLIEEHAPLMFAALVIVLPLGYPWRSRWPPWGSLSAFSASSGLLQQTLPGAARANLGRQVERHAACGAVLHVHGLILERSGMAEDL
jgi:hypothetical protein